MSTSTTSPTPTPLETVPHVPTDDQPHFLAEATEYVEVIQSDQGVVYLGTDRHCLRITLGIPLDLLEQLATAWELGHEVHLAHAVGQLFDGQDGELRFLKTILASAK